MFWGTRNAWLALTFDLWACLFAQRGALAFLILGLRLAWHCELLYFVATRILAGLACVMSLTPGREAKHDQDVRLHLHLRSTSFLHLISPLTSSSASRQAAFSLDSAK